MIIANSISAVESSSKCFYSGSIEEPHRVSGSWEEYGQSYFSICAPLPEMPYGNRFPYGICGPFFDEQEALDALAALELRHPDRSSLAILHCRNFFDAPNEILARDQEKARAKLNYLLTSR